ncbi:MAG: AsmA-like C-terminal region [Verrucomicrobia bacterium]|nr:MAG: AsmA-like C-terminal region [Verrucomicrobiota bacterium]
MSRKYLRRPFQILLLLLGATLLWTAWYGAKRGLTRSWRERIFAEFRAQGIEITFKKLTVDPFQGFVAREVAIFDSNDHQRILAEIDHLTLNIDWSRLIKKRPFVSALELRNARLSLPLNRRDPQSQRLEITRLQARLLMPEKQIRLVHAEARALGLKLRAEGWISNPSALPESDDSNTASWLPLVEKTMTEMNSIQWRGELPLLRLQFSGDMSTPGSVSASLNIEAEEFTARGYSMDSFSLSAAWRDGALDLQEIAFEDKSGSLHAVGRWSPSGELEARVESTLDPCKLAAAFDKAPDPEMLQFRHRPSLRAHIQGNLNSGQPLRITGSVESKAFSWKKEPFESLSAIASWEGPRWSVRAVEIKHKKGLLKGDALNGPGEFRAKLASTLPLPLLVLALPEQPASSPVHWLQSNEPLNVLLEAQGSAPALDACTAWGRVQVGQGTFRNVAFEKFTSPLSLKGGAWNFGPFQLKRTEGIGEGAITYDSINNDLYLHDLRVRLNPTEAMMMVEPDWVSYVSPYRFKGPTPLVTVRGSAKPHSEEHTNISVTLESKGGMNYDFAGKMLPVEEISAQLLFTPHRVQLTSVSGKLFGGKFDGNVDIAVKPDSAPHKASLSITNMDFAALSSLYAGYDDSKGRLNCSFLWKGDDDNARKVDGAGQLSITDGNVFLIPFLGPLSSLLNTVIPGLGVSTAHKATAAFTIKDGVFNTRNLHIDGATFTLRGHGNLRFMDDSMQFYARVNARSLPGLVLFPVSKLFEYAADGKLSKPVWKSRILTRLERSGAESSATDPEPEEPAQEAVSPTKTPPPSPPGSKK